MKIRADLIELWTRLIPFNKQKNIYLNGENNLYPNENERAIMNSPTAKRASIMLTKFVCGSGIEQEDEIVNVKKGYKITDIIRKIGSSISKQNGFYLLVGYRVNESGNLYQVPLDVLEYVKCRIMKEDDDKNSGKIQYSDYEKKSINGKDKKQYFFPYSESIKVAEKQIMGLDENADLETNLRNYTGQVMYVNLTPEYMYAVSKFDAVYNDMDTEYRMSLYSNTITRSGFMGKTAVITSGLDEEQEKSIREDVKKWLGSENSQDIYQLSVDEVDDIDKVLKIIQVESQYDDDMFTNSEKRIRRNILGQANGIPEILVNSGDGSLFGANAETYKNAILFYEDQTEEERMIIESTFKRIGYEVKIRKLSLGEVVKPVNGGGQELPPVNDESELKRLNAQAALKGSVGGVTALLGIQQAVSSGITSVDSALTIIKEIFGIEEEIARRMLGDVKVDPTIK